MENLLAGDRVTSKFLSGIWVVLKMNYDGSCVIVDSDGKHTWTVHTAKLAKVVDA